MKVFLSVVILNDKDQVGFVFSHYRDGIFNRFILSDRFHINTNLLRFEFEPRIAERNNLICISEVLIQRVHVWNERNF